ncbi:hypothetical protein EYF80_052409 [Liparis tanakae]|uniref:Uncharacterized protein n=1 Tax=Liparis tanakae TaxID=230148 RepID=A0A4Z2F9C5_9TELE|nr:hypothetical protein EYF80_052409 [Liparis tanakae]
MREERREERGGREEEGGGRREESDGRREEGGWREESFRCILLLAAAGRKRVKDTRENALFLPTFKVEQQQTPLEDVERTRTRARSPDQCSARAEEEDDGHARGHGVRDPASPRWGRNAHEASGFPFVPHVRARAETTPPLFQGDNGVKRLKTMTHPLTPPPDPSCPHRITFTAAFL